MADIVYNISLGAVAEIVRDSSSQLLVLLMKASNADSSIRDHDDLSALLGATGNTEADFTNYSRKTGIGGTITVDDSNERVDVDIPDQTWSSAGNGTNNTLVDLIVGWEDPNASPPDDTDRQPLTQHDFSVTTDGSDLTAQFNSAGFYRAS